MEAALFSVSALFADYTLSALEVRENSVQLPRLVLLEAAMRDGIVTDVGEDWRDLVPPAVPVVHGQMVVSNGSGMVSE